MSQRRAVTASRTGGFHNESIEAAATGRGIEMVALLTDTHGYQADELHWFEDPISGPRAGPLSPGGDRWYTPV